MQAKHGVARAAGEFALIVAGVLVALAANDWRDARLERREAGAYRDRLRVEVESAMAQQATRRAKFEHARDASLRLVRYLEGDRTAVPRDSLADVLLQSAFVGFTAGQLGTDATYRELVASGQLRLLGGPALRRHVLSYYTAFDQAQDYARRIFPIYQQIARLTGHLPYQLLAGNPPPTPADRARIVRYLQEDPGRVPDLRELHSDVAMLLFMMDRLRVQGDSLLASLRAAPSRSGAKPRGSG